MKWKKVQAIRRPDPIIFEKSTVYINKDIKEIDENTFEYQVAEMSYDEWEYIDHNTKPTLDFHDALLGVDESFYENDNEFSPRIEKYKEYYKSGKWTLKQINILLDRGIITEEEYKYIIGENK